MPVFQPGIPASSRSTIVLGLVALLHATAPGLTGQEIDASTDGREDFVAPSYTLVMEGQSSEPWRWLVSGGSDVVGIYGEQKSWAPDGSGEQIVEWELRMLAGPALQGVPHQIDDDWSTLVPALAAPPADVESGNFVATDMGPTAYDSIRWDLTRGEDDRAVDGRNAQHWILTVNSWLRQEAGESVVPMESKGRADLWFDSELPFSSVPFAVARGSGFPLGVIDPPASRLVRQQALPELRELGLLLRAEITDSQLRFMEGLDGPMTLGPQETVVSVSEVQPDGARVAEVADAEPVALSDYVRLDADRAEALEISQFLTSVCRVAFPAKDGSSADGTVAGTAMNWAGSGFAREAGEATRIAAVTPREAREQACVIGVTPRDAGVGNYAATSPVRTRIRDAGPEAKSAWVTVAGGDAETRTRSMLIAESGTLTIDSLTDERATGTFALTGWMIAAPEGGTATLTEDAEVNVSFVALPAD